MSKSILNIFFLGFLLLFSCNSTNKTANVATDGFNKSTIVNPAFNSDLIFGAWTYTADNPNCDFEFRPEWFLVCDYDGDGTRLYKIDGDSIYLKDPGGILKGKILKVTQDTLTINWQGGGSPVVAWRFRN